MLDVEIRLNESVVVLCKSLSIGMYDEGIALTWYFLWLAVYNIFNFTLIPDSVYLNFIPSVMTFKWLNAMEFTRPLTNALIINEIIEIQI